MNSFKTPEILKTNVEVEMILPNGVSERGQGGGVFRDCLTAWWGEFYGQCTLGSETKVPFIRHDYQMEEWTAVARIIKKGFTEFEYLPVQLSVVILESAIFPSNLSSDDRNIMHYLRQYIKESDKEKLKLFLRFCTGADLLLPSINVISIEFNNTEGLARTPFASTCSCILKLSNTYENFPTFRAEFNSILSSDIWVAVINEYQYDFSQFIMACPML
ncbi:hypothetical protein KUTeg_011556 [Tegillarca granosa]|uniref:HECT domain-containing protein n=1 Tax=Tegillarca granosa TaxID=220873 RepID=A0ABQ9EZF0_TEGGR|nr:hypothetical protein KUTeg_011556 [Tegillarca granosa]